jgi:hypothetical protein
VERDAQAGGPASRCSTPALIVAGGSIVALAMLPFVGTPDRAAWPYMLVSAVIHFGYYVTLAGAYRRGDLSFAYPLMRGVAPLIVTGARHRVPRRAPDGDRRSPASR